MEEILEEFFSADMCDKEAFDKKCKEISEEIDRLKSNIKVLTDAERKALDELLNIFS